MLFKKKVTWNYKDSPIRTKTINVFSPSVPSSKSSTGIYSRSSSDIIRYLPAYFRTLSKFRLSELSACINLKMGKANPPNGFTFTVYTLNSWHCLQQKKGFYENEWRIFPFYSVWLMAGKEHMCFVHNVIIFVNCNLCLGVCLFVCLILTQKPFNQFASNFDWETLESHGVDWLLSEK